jgi:hypothetical protein
MKLSEVKAKMFKTAYALVSCAHFSAGECVSIQHAYTDKNGKNWFDIRRSERGQLPYAVCYPEDHLTDFCL